MERQYCTKCGNKLDDHSKVCGTCGAAVAMPKNTGRFHKKLWLIFVIFGVIVSGLLVLSALTLMNPKSTKDAAVAELTTVAIPETSLDMTEPETEATSVETTTTATTTEVATETTTATEATSAAETESITVEETSETETTGDEKETSVAIEESTPEAETEVETTIASPTYDFVGDWAVEIHIPIDGINWELDAMLTGAEVAEEDRLPITKNFNTKMENIDGQLTMTYAPDAIIRIEDAKIDLIIPTETGLFYVIHAVMGEDLLTISGTVDVKVLSQDYASGIATILRK